MLGVGAPSAWHVIVASFPSRAVKFVGGTINTGTEAKTKQKIQEQKLTCQF